MRYPLISILLAMLCCVLSTPLNAQNSNGGKQSKRLIVGVFDKQTGEPIPAAVLKWDTVFYTTDLNGWVEVPKRSATVRYEISCMGYKGCVGNFPSHEHNHLHADSLTIRLAPSATALETVIVTARKRYAPITAVTATMQQAELTRRSGDNLAKLLETLPGMSSVQSGATIAKPTVQGMNGSRVLLIQNGVKMEGQQWGSEHAPELDPSMAGSIEVIKGADAVRYGSGAMGGVILVNPSALPTQERGSKSTIGVGYASNAHMGRIAFSIEKAVKKIPGMGWRITGSAASTGDYSSAEYALNNTGTRIASATALLGYEAGRLKSQLYYSLYAARLGVFYGMEVSSLEQLQKMFEYGRPFETYPSSYTITNPRQDIYHHIAKASASYSFDNASELSAMYDLQIDDRQEFSIRRGWRNKLPVLRLLLHTHSFSADWQTNKQSIWQTNVGATFVYQQNASDPNTMSVPIIPNYAAVTAGAYFIERYRPSDKLQATAGIRFDHKNVNALGYNRLSQRYGGEKRYNSLSATVSARYLPIYDLVLTSSAGWAWRAPDVNELYSDGMHNGAGTYEIGNETLNAERGLKWSNELSYRTGRFAFKASGFFQWIMDYIYSAPSIERETGKPEIMPIISGVYPVFRYKQNDAIFYGGDLEAEVTLSRHLCYMIDASFIRAHNLDDGTYFPFIPSDRYGHSLRWQATYHSGAVSNAYMTIAQRIVTKQMRFNPELDFVSDTPSAYTIFRFDAGLTWRLRGDRAIEMMLSADNLTNTYYKEYTDRIRYFAHAKGIDVSLRLLFHL